MGVALVTKHTTEQEKEDTICSCHSRTHFTLLNRSNKMKHFNYKGEWEGVQMVKHFKDGCTLYSKNFGLKLLCTAIKSFIVKALEYKISFTINLYAFLCIP